jgi:hypothetical protein
MMPPPQSVTGGRCVLGVWGRGLGEKKCVIEDVGCNSQPAPFCKTRAEKTKDRKHAFKGELVIMKNLELLTFVIVLFVSDGLFAQENWFHMYDGYLRYGVQSWSKTGDGGYVMLSKNNNRIEVVNANSNGQFLWRSPLFNSTNYSYHTYYATSIVADNRLGFVVGGEALIGASNYPLVFSGSSLTVGANNGWVISVCVTADGNVAFLEWDEDDHKVHLKKKNGNSTTAIYSMDPVGEMRNANLQKTHDGCYTIHSDINNCA